VYFFVRDMSVVSAFLPDLIPSKVAVAYGANAVVVNPAFISVGLFLRDMRLALAPRPDFISKLDGRQQAG
jgi:hypothetical protein